MHGIQEILQIQMIFLMAIKQIKILIYFSSSQILNYFLKHKHPIKIFLVQIIIIKQVIFLDKIHPIFFNNNSRIICNNNNQIIFLDNKDKIIIYLINKHQIYLIIIVLIYFNKNLICFNNNNILKIIRIYFNNHFKMVIICFNNLYFNNQ